MTLRPSPSPLDVIRRSRIDMAVRMHTGTALSDEVVSRWRGACPASDAVADVGENRFSMAWERRPHDAFPSYGDCWPAFARDLGGLQRAFVEAGERSPTFSACELIYSNPVTFEEQEPRHGRLERLLLRWLVPGPGDGWLPTPEGIVADATYPMSRGADGGRGKLCVRMQSLPTETAEQVYGMTLSAQCVVESGEIGVVEAAFDVAFDWIVRGYATLGDPVDG